MTAWIGMGPIPARRYARDIKLGRSKACMGWICRDCQRVTYKISGQEFLARTRFNSDREEHRSELPVLGGQHRMGRSKRYSQSPTGTFLKCPLHLRDLLGVFELREELAQGKTGS